MNPEATATPLQALAHPQFRLPAFLLGSSLLAVAAFATAHFLFADRLVPIPGGWRLRKGSLLCPRAEPRTVVPGTFVVLWLGDASGYFVEPTWGRVLSPTSDPSIWSVLLVGESLSGASAPLQTDKHGFSAGETLPVPLSCVADVMLVEPSVRARPLCGDALATRGHSPQELPAAPVDLVGRRVEVLLGDTAGGDAWTSLARAHITSVSITGHVATIQIEDVDESWAGQDPTFGAPLLPGTTFEITWDCVLRYL